MSVEQLEVLSPSRLSFTPSRLSFRRWLAARLVDAALALSTVGGGKAWEEWRDRW